MRKYLYFLVLVLVSNFGISQTHNFHNIPSTKKNFIQASFGLDMALMLDLNYGRVIQIKERNYILSANATLPMGDEAMDDSRFELNFTGSLWENKNWAIPASLGIHTAFVNNKMNQMASVGAQLGVYPGWYKKSGFVAMELIYDKFLVSHIRNSEVYKEVYYEDAKDGWYKNPGGNFHLGVTAGKSLKKGELNLRAGGVFSEKGRMPNVPYYAVIAYKLYF